MIEYCNISFEEKMKTEIVGMRHVQEVINLITRSRNLLNTGKDILPYCLWQDRLDSLIEEITDYISEETHFDLERENEDE